MLIYAARRNVQCFELTGTMVTDTVTKRTRKVAENIH